ncbi:MAG: T9SS C-terminal target domain-containing protein [Calditrichaeota bacterium]|nr:MAG: T9SS C-terminal target domain-containing protein [Calditrichota bacterium]
MNITISNNEATSDGGGIAVFNNVNLTLANTILWYNSPEEIYALPYQLPNTITVTYSNIQGGLPGIPSNGYSRVNWLENNIDMEPNFVDMEASNYRLMISSPCIDAGTDFLIIENDTLLAVAKSRYNGKAPDLGRYESLTIAIGPKVSYRSTSEQMILKKNYPNPFNPSTTIEFTIPQSGFVTLKIYNNLGEEVATLVSETLAAGSYQYQWDARGLASGVYFYQLQFQSGFFQIRKMLVVK